MILLDKFSNSLLVRWRTTHSLGVLRRVYALPMVQHGLGGGGGDAENDQGAEKRDSLKQNWNSCDGYLKMAYWYNGTPPATGTGTSAYHLLFKGVGVSFGDSFCRTV